MSDFHRRIAIAAIAGAMALASTTMTVGTASAALPPCNAPSGSYCLGIDNQTSNAHSFYVYLLSGRRCLTGHIPGKTMYHPNIHIHSGTVALDKFDRDNCAGTPQITSYTVQDKGKWTIERVE